VKLSSESSGFHEERELSPEELVEAYVASWVLEARRGVVAVAWSVAV
jgi:hypothetical protein